MSAGSDGRLGGRIGALACRCGAFELIAVRPGSKTESDEGFCERCWRAAFLCTPAVPAQANA